MSQRMYEEWWRRAEEEVAKVVAADQRYVKEDVIEDRQRAFREAATNYIKYSLCVNKLNLCLDQIIHVQKRQTVRTLLEATLSRLLQVKQELVNMDVSDFNYLDEILIDMKLTHYDVELQVPRFYRRDREERIDKFNQDIDRILEEQANPPSEVTEEQEETEKEGGDEKKVEEDEPTGKKKVSKSNPNRPPPFKKVELTESQKMFKAIILMIQKHERARRARLETQELKEKQRLQHDIAWLIHKPIPEDILESSVRLIQRVWRGYATRKRLIRHHNRNRTMMGELTPSYRPYKEVDRVKEVEKERRVRQKVADEEYARDYEQLVAKVRHRDDDVKDDIADFLRWWIENWYRKVGELPAFPDAAKIEPTELMGLPKDTPAEWIKKMVKVIPTASITCPGLPPYLMGGSALIAARFWVEPEFYDLAHTVAMLAKGKKGAAAGKDKKEKLTKQQLKELKEEEKEKKRLEAEAKKKELEEKMKRGVVPVPTELLNPMEKKMDESQVLWREYHDLEWNPDQKHRQDMPLSAITYQQRDELQEVVDDLMRLELQRLQAALDRDRGKKKKGGEKKKKKPKPKKGKKDPTGDRTTESLFKELVENGIIRKTGDTRIDSVFCQPSWNNCELRGDPWWQNPPPNTWDVKQVVKEYCILPLGSSTVHRSAPLVRSVLLAGYPDCGQRPLAAAVAAETGAVLFDLSPTNTAGKYPGKKGLNMLVHLVNKMSRILQPSVIFVDGGEKPFYKKVPKPEKSDNPKLLKKQLPKIVKGVTAEDQVLVLATSDNPFAGQAKSMTKTYNKIIPVLPPDQATQAAFWHSRLMTYHGVDRDFLYTPLAWCAQGYPLPTIDRVLLGVMTPERIIALKYRPLDPQEILDVLLNEPPITEDQRRKLVDWYQSTYPLARKRAEKVKADQELRDKLAAIEAKKEEQKKKKKKS